MFECIVNRYQTEKRTGCKLMNEPIITEQAARRLSLFEKFFLTPGCSIILCKENKKDDSLYWIKLVAEIVDLEMTQETIGLLSETDIHKVF